MRNIWLVLVLGFVAAADCLAHQENVSAATLRERYDGLAYLLTGAPPDMVGKARKTCAAGQAPSSIAWSRSHGSESQADASDNCPTVLLRIARDGTLLGLYRDLVLELKGHPASYENLPSAIAAAAMRGGKQVDIGNQLAASISPALALDAGFTVAFQKHERATAGMPGLAALKPIAERCLSQQEPDLGLCYATGYTYGARAASGQPMAMPPQLAR